MAHLLTKSKYMQGQQCSRLLWLSTNKLLPEKTIAEKQKLEQGHEFEEYAHKLFPEAENLAELELEENLEKTKELIEQKKTIFEAGLKVDNLFLRADVLEPTKKGWNLYEIKASTKQKPEHIPDLAFQKFVCEKAGLKIEKCFVLHLNKDFIKNGEINPKELSIIEEVTEKVNLIDDVEKNSKLYLEIMNSKEKPEILISKNCNSPYPCAVKKDCWGTLPKNNVLHLTNWRVYWKLFDDGFIDLKDVPQGTKLTPKDETILEGETQEKIMVSKEHIKHFLNSLKYPLCHLDFETFDTAVPIFDKSRPWQKMPFQYSVHIQPENGDIVHYEFLAEDGEDPRPKLLENLKEHTKCSGKCYSF
jgi:CRISPR/Cas system-associated exonuclease Cas4 (RecB family)